MRISDLMSDVCSSDLQGHRMSAPDFVLAEAHEQFVIMIADIAALAPRLLPPVVAARALRPFDGEAALEPDAVGQQEAELRRRDQQLALARQRPGDRKSTRLNSSH